MKKFVLLTLFTLLIVSCENNPANTGTELVGKWKLVEILTDPGDGSGTFHPVKSNKTVEFHSDGTITSNGSLCVVSVQADNPSAGTYSLTDSTIISEGCMNDFPLKTHFRQQGSVLIISYLCIEPCREKYVKN